MSKSQIIPMYKNDLFFMEFGEYEICNIHNVRVSIKSKFKSKSLKNKLKPSKEVNV